MSRTKRERLKCDCDQFPKVSKAVLNLKDYVYITAEKSIKHLGYFCEKICYRDFSKLAQSGHTGFCVWERQLILLQKCASVELRSPKNWFKPVKLERVRTQS